MPQYSIFDNSSAPYGKVRQKRTIEKVFVANARRNDSQTPRPKATRAREPSQRVPIGSAAKTRSPKSSPTPLAQFNISTPIYRKPKRGRSGSMGRDDSMSRHAGDGAHQAGDGFTDPNVHQRIRERNESEDTELRAGSARSAPNTPSGRRPLSLRKRSSSRMSKARSVDDQISNQIEMKGQSRTNSPDCNNRMNSSSSIDTARPASN